MSLKNKLICNFFGINFFGIPPYSSAKQILLDLHSQTNGKLLSTIVVAAAIAVVLLVVAYFLSYSNLKEAEKSSEYECGFDPFDNATRQPFEVHFYIVSILFLIFDVEVALLFPWASGFSYGNIGPGFWMALLFLLIITLGFVYEWCRGALSWPHPALSLEYKK